MKKLVLLLSCIPFLSFSQTINEVDAAERSKVFGKKPMKVGC